MLPAILPLLLQGLFSRLLNKKLSKVTAKNRLQMVLVQDRSGLSASDMDDFKEDIMGIISKYFLIQKKHLDVSWERNDNETALVINMPVTGRLKEVPKQAVAAG